MGIQPIVALELIYHDAEGEFITVQCAINNTLAVPFSFHKSVRDDFKDELEYFNYLERNTQAMLEAFGDARKWPKQGFQEVEGAEA